MEFWQIGVIMTFAIIGVYQVVRWVQEYDYKKQTTNIIKCDGK
jgi:hypothetical protein